MTESKIAVTTAVVSLGLIGSFFATIFWFANNNGLPDLRLNANNQTTMVIPQ